MDGDISKALTYQVKKEIAQRYFGTRRQIENDLSNLQALLSELNGHYENRIGPALVRIYSLLMDEDIIEHFLQLIHWPDKPFYDAYVVESETIRSRLLERLRSHGWFDKSRFLNMVEDSYRLLYREYEAILDKYEEAREEIEIIREEFKLFRNKYSLSEIMSFVRNLDFQGQDMAKALGSNLNSFDENALDDKLKLDDIEKIAEALPELPELPHPDQISEELRDLASTAFARHPELAESAIDMAKR